MIKRLGMTVIGSVAVVLIALVVCNCSAQTSEEESLKKGVDLVRHDKFDEAIAEFNNVVAVNPKSTSAYYNLGFAYDKKGDLGKAILNFTKAIEIDPALADAYYNRGFAYYKKGAFDSAITDYNKVIEIGPDSADAYYGLGLVYSQKGDLNKAITEYTNAIKARPNFALAYDARAVAYVTKKNYLAAMADVNKAQSLGFRSRPLKRAQAALVVAEKEPVKPVENTIPKQSMTAQELALKVTGVIFLLIAFLHLLRLVFRVKVAVGRFTVPLWLSALGIIVLSALSFWILRI